MDVGRPFSLYIPALGEKSHKFKAENIEKVLVINCANGKTIFTPCDLFSFEHLKTVISILMNIFHN
jgi:hypothetical protein